jgi:hypothetical protein
MITNSTFQTTQVVTYLQSINQPNDSLQSSFPSQVKSQHLFNWFEDNLPNGKEMFREMECHVTQHFDLPNTPISEDILEQIIVSV